MRSYYFNRWCHCGNSLPEGDGGHHELDGLERRLGRGPVVEHQQDAAGDLDREEEQGHAAQVVDRRVAVGRNHLVSDELARLLEG